ncbi:hypothetical protein [Paenibacillus sp. 1001270B_150601_E10]|uniref:hypothetical protein n=1 Tax=Paenibacillus sp. 1001270B_150601_E10 TaxID=2787079 RepID=UPI00189C66C7|nr:hypothetical protein [Paenibacillus sp. 1001270B_150601_E10]
MATIQRVGEELLINTTGGLNYQPTITGSGGPVNESILIAWNSASENQFRGQWIEAVGGTKNGENFIIPTSPIGVISKPSIDGLFYPGGFVAVWLDEGDRKIKGQRYTAAGSKVGDEFQVGGAAGEGALRPVILVLNPDSFVVAWTGNNLNASPSERPRPWMQIFSTDGTSLGSFPVNTTMDEDNPFHYGPQITRLADGRFVIAWTQDLIFGGPRVLGQIFNPDGSKSGEEFRINTRSVPRQENIAITGIVDGNFVGAWVAGDNTVRAQLFRPDGTNVYNFEFFITGRDQGICRNPALTPLNDGGFVAAWTEKSATSGDPSGDAVRAQAFAADGFENSSKILINTTTNGDQFGPVMTSSFPIFNHFTVAWVSNDNPNSNDYFVRAQVFQVT